ncbi:AAA family ATPase [Amycolatopsis lexingtonensis]|uniref:phosphatase domain-containing protein n=1 Tax=Amycolatopsis lexingtonensis TaxID=218822 RepID=UPI003F6F135B
MPGTLHIFRGLPGTGKTTKAGWLRRIYGGVLAGRDHFRALYGTEQNPGDPVIEDQITQLQASLILHALSVGDHVYVDDMNLRARYVWRLLQLARQQDAEVVVHDLTNVSVETAVVQAANPDRARPVGEAVITDLHRRFIKGRPYPLPMPVLAEDELEADDRYVGDPALPWAVLVDVDGTVAQMEGRSPYDMTRVGEDKPKRPVIDVVEALERAGFAIVFVSARNEVARPATEEWIRRYTKLRGFSLYMRADGDGRDDRVVKREIFDRHIRERFYVHLVLDDRSKVVGMWRALGLTCLQVAPGDF